MGKLFIEYSGALGKTLSYFYMLGADALALAAADAVGRLATVLSGSFVGISGAVFTAQFLVHSAENIGNIDGGRTAVGAVFAGGAGDSFLIF